MAVRILLGEIATEWRRMLVDLARDDSDLEIVGTAEHAMDVLLQAEELKVHVVVLAQLPGGHEPGVCSHLMLEFPNLAVLLLPASPASDILWRMVLRKESWRGISKEGLRAALKASFKDTTASSEPAAGN